MSNTVYDEMINIVEEAKACDGWDILLKKMGLVSLIASVAYMADEDDEFLGYMHLAQDLVFSNKNEAHAKYARNVIDACIDSWFVHHEKNELYYQEKFKEAVPLLFDTYQCCKHKSDGHNIPDVWLENVNTKEHAFLKLMKLKPRLCKNTAAITDMRNAHAVVKRKLWT